MDDDTVQLARHLCTRAGMLMEDASAHAILVGRMTLRDLTGVAREIRQAANDMLALADAAEVLLRRAADET